MFSINKRLKKLIFIDENCRIQKKFYRWEMVDGLSNNEISKIAAAIPLIGYIIIFNDTFLSSAGYEIISGSAEGIDYFLFETLTKLRMSFWGAIFLLLSLILFRIFAPEVLSQEKNDLSFADLVISSYSCAEISRIEDSVKKETWQVRTDQFEKIKDFPKIIAKVETPKYKFIQNKEDDIRTVSREWWLGLMHQNPKVRYFTLLLAIAGYTFLILPTLDIAQAVFRDFFR